MILYEGENGRLSDDPEKTYAGVAFVDNTGSGGPIELASCQASAANRSVVDSVRKLRTTAGLPDMADEAPGSPFDAWF